MNFWNYLPTDFPNFSKSKYVEIIMKQNQMLSIPYGWWWTNKCEIDSIAVSCNCDSIFSMIFKKINILK